MFNRAVPVTVLSDLKKNQYIYRNVVFCLISKKKTKPLKYSHNQSDIISCFSRFKVNEFIEVTITCLSISIQFEFWSTTTTRRFISFFLACLITSSLIRSVTRMNCRINCRINCSIKKKTEFKFLKSSIKVILSHMEFKIEVLLSHVFPSPFNSNSGALQLQEKLSPFLLHV